MLRTTTRRPGFTLVELMVAAAVCVLIMAVLATAFQLGIDTMRQMRSTGELMDQLRGATTALKNDLKAAHLLDKDYQPIALSKYRWDTCQVAGNPGNFSLQMLNPNGKIDAWVAPVAGFVRIGSGPMTSEGIDADGLASYRATNHFLHFTTILSGLSEEEYYYANIPGVPTYSSTAAEIAYFLEPLGAAAAGSPTTFRLIRRQRLVALNDTQRRDRRWPPAPPAPQPDTRSAVFSLQQPSLFLNTLQELTNPANRLGQNMAAVPNTVPPMIPNDNGLAPMASRPGEDTLLSNVISFEVQVIYAGPSDPRLPWNGFASRAFAPGADTPNTPTAQGTTSSAPFDVLPPCPANGNPALIGMNVYDSWSNDFAAWTSLNQASGTVTPSINVPPLLIRVQALQIRIRVWDPKLQNARQVTFIQDL